MAISNNYVYQMYFFNDHKTIIFVALTIFQRMQEFSSINAILGKTLGFS